MRCCQLDYQLAAYDHEMYNKRKLYDRFFEEKKRGLGKHVNLPNAPAPRATIGARPQGSATRPPRFYGSNGWRVIAALPVRVAE